MQMLPFIVFIMKFGWDQMKAVAGVGFWNVPFAPIVSTEMKNDIVKIWKFEEGKVL